MLWRRYQHGLCSAWPVQVGPATGEGDPIVGREDDQGIIQDTCSTQLLEHESNPLIHPANGGVLSGQVSSGGWGVRDEVRHLHILRVVGLGGPVWNSPHATLPIAKLLTERPILWLGVPAAVGVMEGNIEEKRPVTPRLQEFPDQQFNSSDVPPDLEDRAILLRVCKVKWIHHLRPHVLLPNDACVNASLAQQQRQALHPVERVEVVDILVQAVHSILMLGQASEEAGAAG